MTGSSTHTVSAIAAIAFALCTASARALHQDGTPTDAPPIRLEALWAHRSETPDVVLLADRLAPLHDLDGDGVLDLLVGFPAFSWNDVPVGRVMCLSGNDGHVLHDVTGDPQGRASGHDLVLLDDVDGDGVPDFAVGAPGVRHRSYDYRHPDASVPPGTVAIHSGRTAARLAKFSSPVERDRFGGALLHLPDRAGGSLGTLIVAAPGGDENPGTGAVHAYAIRSATSDG